MIYNTNYLSFILTAISLAAPSSVAVAGGSDTAFNFQGRLLQGGVPYTGDADLQFTLYDAESGGTLIAGPSELLDVSVSDGQFTVTLDFLDVFNGDERWLEIEVRIPPGGGSYTPLSPRQRIRPAPYAMHAYTAAGVGDGALPAQYTSPVEFTHSDNTYAGRSMTLFGNSGGQAIFAEHPSRGVFGRTTGASGTGVLGYAVSTDANDARGVWGRAAGPAGTGVYGTADDTGSTLTNFGVFGSSDGMNGHGVHGRALGDGGLTIGVSGSATGANGRGVSGLANHTSGNTVGVYGEVSSPTGWAGSFHAPNRGILVSTTADTGSTHGIRVDVDNPDGYAAYFTGGRNYLAGDVGIKTTVPGASLAVETGTTNSSGGGGFVHVGPDNSTHLALDPNEMQAYSGTSPDATLWLNFWGGNVRIADGGGDVDVAAGGGDVIMADAGGRVGIGQDIPAAKLDVTSNTANAGNNTAIFRADGIGTWASHIHFGTTGDWYIRSASAGGKVIIQDNFGPVGIGTSSPNPKAALQVNGRLYFGSENYIRDGGFDVIFVQSSVEPELDNEDRLGSPNHRWSSVWAVDGSINTSDARLKENIADLPYGLAQVMDLRPVSFTWKDRPERGTNLGLLAQDVLEVIPEVVVAEEIVTRETDDGPVRETRPVERLGMTYSELIPVLIRAVQEQQGIIASQQREITTQRAALVDLEARLEALESRMNQ